MDSHSLAAVFTACVYFSSITRHFKNQFVSSFNFQVYQNSNHMFVSRESHESVSNLESLPPMWHVLI